MLEILLGLLKSAVNVLFASVLGTLLFWVFKGRKISLWEEFQERWYLNFILGELVYMSIFFIILARIFLRH